MRYWFCPVCESWSYEDADGLVVASAAIDHLDAEHPLVEKWLGYVVKAQEQEQTP